MIGNTDSDTTPISQHVHTISSPKIQSEKYPLQIVAFD